MLEEVERAAENIEGAAIAPNNYEGIRLNFDREHGDGWILIRMSLHEAILPINTESRSAGGCKKMAAALLSMIKKFDKVDCSLLEKYIES